MVEEKSSCQKSQKSQVIHLFHVVFQYHRKWRYHRNKFISATMIRWIAEVLFQTSSLNFFVSSRYEFGRIPIIFQSYGVFLKYVGQEEPPEAEINSKLSRTVL